MSTHTIEYTRTSVAFPGIPILHNDVDDLHIHEVDGDGEFRIAFIDLTTHGVVPHLEVFGDGLELFYDPRVQNVMHRWRRAEVGRAVRVPKMAFERWFEKHSRRAA